MTTTGHDAEAEGVQCASTDEPELNDWQRTVEDALNCGHLDFLEPLQIRTCQQRQWHAAYMSNEQYLRSHGALLRLADYQDHLYHYSDDGDDGNDDECPKPRPAEEVFEEFSTFTDLTGQVSSRCESNSSISLASVLGNSSSTSLLTPATIQRGGKRDFSNPSAELMSPLGHDLAHSAEPQTEPQTKPQTEPQTELHANSKCDPVYDLLTPISYVDGPAAQHIVIETRTRDTSKPTAPTRSKRRRCFVDSLPKSPQLGSTTSNTGKFEPVVPLSITTVLPQSKSKNVTMTRTSWYPTRKTVTGYSKSAQSPHLCDDGADWDDSQPLRAVSQRLQTLQFDKSTGCLPHYEPPHRLSLPRMSMLHVDHPLFEGILANAERDIPAVRGAAARTKPELANVAHTSTSPFNHRWIHPTQNIIVTQKKKKPQVSFMLDNEFSAIFHRQQG